MIKKARKVVIAICLKEIAIPQVTFEFPKKEVRKIESRENMLIRVMAGIAENDEDIASPPPEVVSENPTPRDQQKRSFFNRLHSTNDEIMFYKSFKKGKNA